MNTFNPITNEYEPSCEYDHLERSGGSAVGDSPNMFTYAIAYRKWLDSLSPAWKQNALDNEIYFSEHITNFL